MEWVFVLWVTVNSGSLTNTKMTEAQCRAAIAEIESSVDPLMAWCVGPAGERVRTSNISERRRKFLGELPPPAAPPAPKVSKGFGL